MPRGTIKTLKTEKGFGFIKPNDGSTDVFFHATGLSKDLSFDDLVVGDAVSYDTERGDKGIRAKGVQKC